MPLEPGARLGPYEIAGTIGAGGMGEVYRARDTRLDRTVAIKVLPDLFASDGDRLARFEREAKTLAALNHPNVAQIFGTETLPSPASGQVVHALAMEFVDGEDLSERLARGPIPVAEALPIARQIAEALDAAHDRGIVHRDLKPANVKVREDGVVKVLDFGLAKAADPGAVRRLSGAPDLSNLARSPTFTSPAMTQMGVILGTAAYMSPEQAKGKAVDRGSDLWSFGAVLYEMLTGRPPFNGETVTDVLAAIVTRDPDWDALPAATPASIRRLLRRCMDRDRRRRLADAGEARFQIEEAIAAPADVATVRGAARDRRALVPWAIAALLGIALAAILPRTWRAQPNAEIGRYSLDIPPKVALMLIMRPSVAVAPDGRTVVFAGTSDGVDRLYVRRADAYESAQIPGTEGGSNPVISPDGKYIAFATPTKLMKVPLTGGEPEQLADLSDPRGLSWDEQGTIVFVPSVFGGVWKVPSSGGTAEQVTQTAQNERTHRWPQLLPGGAVLFTVGSPTSPDSYDDAVIAAVMPDGSRRTVLPAAAMARYVTTGHLVFARRGELFVVPFDARRAEVKGTPAPVIQDVAGDTTTGAAHFAVSASGTLVYISARTAQGAAPAWVAPATRPEALPLPPGAYTDIAISPDGQRAAFTLIAGGGRDVWVHHFQRRTFTRMTFSGLNGMTVWSRDGATIYYSAIESSGVRTTIMRRPADGSRAAEPIVSLDDRGYLNDIAPDGASVIVNVIAGASARTLATARSSLARLALQRDAKPVPLLEGATGVSNGRVSPDGRWLAYTSGESGRPEVYVRPYPEGDGRWPVSTGGGEEPRWSKDGGRLYYREGTTLMAVPVRRGVPSFEAGRPAPLVTGIHPVRTESGLTYDVDPTSERFLMVRLSDDTAAAQSLRLIVNWARELR